MTCLHCRSDRVSTHSRYDYSAEDLRGEGYIALCECGDCGCVSRYYLAGPEIQPDWVDDDMDDPRYNTHSICKACGHRAVREEYIHDDAMDLDYPAPGVVIIGRCDDCGAVVECYVPEDEDDD